MTAPRKMNKGSTCPASARAWLPFLLLPLLALLPSGCRNCHLVEAELRKKEHENRELHERLQHAESVNAGLMREVYGNAAPPATMPGAGAHAGKPTPEAAAQIYGLKDIALGRGTGGYDDDRQPGDEALQVVLEPRDSDGHAIKAPGTVQITALEIRPEGTKVPLSTWEVPPDKLRKLWKSGFMSTGYVIVLPWQKCPTSTKLRVVVRFTAPDGRSFEADKDVTIRLMKGAPPPAPPVDGHAPMPEGDTPLPLPRSTEPESRGAEPPIAPTVLWQSGGPARAASLALPVPRR